MIILTNPTFLEFKLGGSTTSSQLPFYVAYVDSTSTTYNPIQSNGVSNNTTSVTLLNTPVLGTSRTLKYLSIHNEDSVSSQVIVQINDTSNTRILIDVALDSGDRLEYTDTVGFRVLTSTGQIKTGSSGSGMIYPSSGIAVSTGSSWGASLMDNSTNWDTAYSWVNTNGANAVTAYGWGNHASAGYLTGITSLQVTTALGYTPYNATNPSGYITASALSSYVPTSRTLTINGTALDLSADRTWTIAASAALSGLTAATATNTINNANFGQEWQWNSLAAGTGLKLSSTSTGAASNTQSIFGVYQSGANATSGQTTYGAIFSNIHTGTSSTNIAAKFSASGATNNYAAIFENGNVGIGTTAPPTNPKLAVVSGSITGSGASDSTIQLRHATENVGHSTAIEFTFGNGNNSYCGSRILGETASGGGGNLHFQTGSSSLGTYSTKMYIAKAGNVGIGTTSPVASAILDLTSTTQGFLPPRMTATQASAISSPAKGLILYSTDTNGTFTSAGLWMYNGTIWKLILAE